MDTAKEKELIGRLEALEATSEKHLQTLETTVELMGQVLDMQGRILAWATTKGFRETEEKGKGD